MPFHKVNDSVKHYSSFYHYWEDILGTSARISLGMDLYEHQTGSQNIKTWAVLRVQGKGGYATEQEYTYKELILNILGYYIKEQEIQTQRKWAYFILKRKDNNVHGYTRLILCGRDFCRLVLIQSLVF